MAAGWDVVQWNGLWTKVLKPSLIAPFAGLVVAFALMTVIVWLVARRSPAQVNRVFRRGQLVSGGFVALTHGTNDAQKTMGIIALALVASGDLDADFSRPPTWVIVLSALAMAAGTYAGGWRIIRTLGHADREDRPTAGVRRPDRVRVDPVDDRAFRLSRLDDARDLGLGDGQRARRAACTPSAGAWRATSSSPGSSRSRWPASSARSWSSSRGLPGGELIVFGSRS